MTGTGSNPNGRGAPGEVLRMTCGRNEWLN